MIKKKRIPIEMTVEEEAVFWEKNDFTHYIDDTDSIELELSSDLKKKILDHQRVKKSEVTEKIVPNEIWTLHITATPIEVVNVSSSTDDSDNRNINGEESSTRVYSEI